MIIGITGGTGCGKTTALNVIRQLGGIVLDCDAIYHQLLKTDTDLLNAISNRFPGTVFQGQLDRKRLGSIVFSDPDALEDLNRITHSAVKQQVLMVLKDTPPLVAIDAIALFESGLAELCHITVAITAPEEDRIKRLMARDCISEEYARMRIAAQRPQSDFVRLCDHHLENSGTAAQFQDKCLAFFRSTDIIEETEKKENSL